MRVELICDGLGFAEGPVALPDGRVGVTSISHGAVHLVDPGGAPVETIVTGGGPNGMTLGLDGALYVAQNGGVWGAPGPAPAGVQVIRDGRAEYVVDGLGAPNDLVLGPDGRLWVTDTVAAFPWGEPGLAEPGAAYAIDLATGECVQVLEGGPVFTNGLVFTPDGGRLLISATLPREVVGYRVTPSGLVDPEVVIAFDEGGPDGMAADGESFWVALTTAHRVARFDLVGTEVDSVALEAGALPTNVCRDHDGSGLYVTLGLAGALVHLGPGPLPL